MRASLRVNATLRQSQPLHRTPADQVLLHNLRCIFRSYVAIPHCFGIYHHSGPVLALVQASGFVDPHPAIKSCFSAQLFQPRMQLTISIVRTGGPRRIGRADIVADKNVALKRGQKGILPGGINLGTDASRVTPRPSAASFSPKSPCGSQGFRSPPDTRFALKRFPESTPPPSAKMGV